MSTIIVAAMEQRSDEENRLEALFIEKSRRVVHLEAENRVLEEIIFRLKEENQALSILNSKFIRENCLLRRQQKP